VRFVFKDFRAVRPRNVADGHRLKDVLQFLTKQGRPVKWDFTIFLQFHIRYIYTAGKMLGTHQPSTRQTFRSRLSRISPLWLIVLVWAASNLLLLALQALGFGVGFNVHPLGEDREMIRLMANYPGLELDHQFWTKLETRNPLAPWWYQAFSPLIFLLPEGLYLLRKLVDLFLATSVYLLVDQISRKRFPKFALACGVLVLFWNFSSYQEQILWIPLTSFGFSILSVYFYCRYLDSERATGDDFVISLLLFFVALGTYTIQCGVPVAVFLLSLFRRQEAGGSWRLSAALGGAVKDTIFFGILFVLFVQIWITASDPMGDFFHLDPGYFLRHFLRSLANLFWHYDTSYYIHSVIQHWPIWVIGAGLGVSAILFYCLFAGISRNEVTSPAARSSVPNLDMILVLAVFCALATPTLLLESTTIIWSPGTRSRMFQQGFQPVIYVSVLFLLTEYLIRRAGRRVEYVRNVGIALLFALAVVIGLEYNRQLSEQTMFEQKLETALKMILPALGKPTHFIVKMNGMKFGVWGSGCAWSMPSLFVQAAYNSNAVWLDPVYEGEPKVSKPVTFGSDQQGIYSPESGAWIPYRDVVLVEFDGRRATRLTSVDQETFSGYGALYAREEPFAAGF